jgi:GNAT superfamily N-acetyltransferase
MTGGPGPGERELGPGETHLAFGPMRQLRSHFESVEEFVNQVDGFQRPEGYRLVASFADGDAVAVAAGGFRRLHMLAWGDVLYIDDLVTLVSHRGRGHASRLLGWILDEARRLGCAQVHLDSAPHRHPAHRLYLGDGYHISAFHFSRSV